jgi:hypothetical protein
MFTPKATLYALSEPLNFDGFSFDHVVVSAIAEDAWGPAETIALPASAAGVVYINEGLTFPYQEEDTVDKAAALKALGYEVLEPAPAQS